MDGSQCGCQPVVCPPQYCVHDYYTPRMVPHIHPIVHIHRQNIVNVPHHCYQTINQRVVVDSGCPSGGGSSCPCMRQ